jgi:MoaA/NifB/PqqE/SkfB family radical SAM enzyme
MSREKADLVKLDFNVTNYCNYRCIHCCFSSGQLDMGEMSFENIESVLRAFVSIGGRRIDITGGEPLMRKDILSIVALAKQLGIKTELVTNASLLTEKKLEFFKKVGLDGIAVSLDGSTAEGYNVIRRRDERTFNKVIRMIKRSAELGFYTKVNTVVFASNMTDLANISMRAIGLGAEEHGFYYFSPIGRGDSSYCQVADPLEWLKVIRNDLWPLKNSIKFSIETPIIETELAQSRNLKIGCFMQDPWHLQILPHGNVYPCAIMSSYDHPVGNLYGKALADLWNSPDLRNGKYYEQNILPLMEKNAACVDYPSFSHLIKSGDYKFVCLCTKFPIEELMA